MTKKKIKKNKNYLWILLVLAILLALIYFGFIQQTFLQFEFGFLPYGESVNQMTDIGFECSVSNGILESYSLGGFTYYTLTCNGKYWDMETDYFTLSSMSISGNDFETRADFGAPGSGATAKATFITTKDFSDKDFKVNLLVPNFRSYGIPAASSGVSVFLTNGIEEIALISFSSQGFDKNIIISPSVISNKITLYVNGEKENTFELSENLANDYKVKIYFSSSSGWYSRESSITPDFIMSNPSYRQQFGCTKEPGEQYYVSIFNEGDTVNINKLDRFKKFCLAEAPLKIYSVAGSTTEVEVLGGLVNAEEYIVPIGQIWSIEYIGELGILVTECEEEQIYNNNEDICMARTVVSLTCPTGSIFDFKRGICTIETAPILYNISTVETHQLLQNENMFRFTHIYQEEEFKTPSSIQIGVESFVSKGLSVDEKASFNFKGKEYLLSEDEKIKLDDFISVEITEIQTNPYKINDFKIEYTFFINIDFLDISYVPYVIYILNDYQSFDGGIILTKTNNIGTTTIQKINKKLILGETTFNIDPTNLVELKARPFIIIKTPMFDYYFDSATAIIVDGFEEEDFSTTEQKESGDDKMEIGEFIKTPFFIYTSAGIAVFVILVILILKRKKIFKKNKK